MTTVPLKQNVFKRLEAFKALINAYKCLKTARMRKAIVGGNFEWTPSNYNCPPAYLRPSQAVIKPNIPVTKSDRLNYSESIS